MGVVLSLTKVQREALTKIESMPEKDYPFNINVKEHLMRVADPAEDYIVSAGVSFGLRVGDFIKITRGMLEPLINEEPPIQLPEIVTKKEGVKAYPFIDRDAKEAIKRLLTIMDTERRTDPKELMLKFKNLRRAGREVNDILKELFKKAQIHGEFRVRFHIFRKFLTDQLASVCAEDKWKHFVGKQTRTPYVSQEGKEAYTKVMEFTNVNHKNIAVPDDVRKLEREISSLREQLIQRDKRLLDFEKRVEEIEDGYKDMKYLKKGNFVITYYDKFMEIGDRTGEAEEVADEAIDRKIEEYSKEIEKLKKLRKSRDYEVK